MKERQFLNLSSFKVTKGKKNYFIVNNNIKNILEVKEKLIKAMNQIFGINSYKLNQLTKLELINLSIELIKLAKDIRVKKIGISGSFASNNMGDIGSYNSKGELRTKRSDIDFLIIKHKKNELI